MTPQEYFKENPIKLCFYADRDDQLTDKQVAAIVEACDNPDNDKRLAGIDAARESFDEWWFDTSWEYYEKPAIDEARAAYCEQEGLEEAPDDFDDIARDAIVWDDDAFDVLARHTPDVRVVLYPVKPNGDLYDDVQEIAELLGIENPDDMGQMYTSEALCLCGELDVEDILNNLYQGKRLASVTITPDDASNLVLHCGWNGSGNMGDIEPTKTVTLPVQVRADKTRKYGVDAVYGFTGRFWQHTPTVSWEQA